MPIDPAEKIEAFRENFPRRPLGHPCCRPTAAAALRAQDECCGTLYSTTTKRLMPTSFSPFNSTS
jgi:hypothetical protein